MIRYIYEHRIPLVLIIIFAAMVGAARHLQTNYPSDPNAAHDRFMEGCTGDGIHKIVCASYWWKRQS